MPYLVPPGYALIPIDEESLDAATQETLDYVDQNETTDTDFVIFTRILLRKGVEKLDTATVPRVPPYPYEGRSLSPKILAQMLDDDMFISQLMNDEDLMLSIMLYLVTAVRMLQIQLSQSSNDPT